MPEDVVLQFGPVSNSSLVHFWNSLYSQARYYVSAGEESFRARTLFGNAYEAQNLKPRTVIFDAKLSSVTQKESVEPVIELTGWRRDAFVKFDSRSHVPVDVPIMKSIQDTQPFENGMQYAKSTEVLDGILDSVRCMVEECDGLGRFISVADSVGFWGGYSTSVIESLSDDFGPQSVDSFGIFTSEGLDSALVEGSIVDKALNMSRLTQVSDRVFPLSLSPGMTIDKCVLASLMETFVTDAVFPLWKGPMFPSGLASVGFGMADDLKDLTKMIKDMSVKSKWQGHPSHQFARTNSGILDDISTLEIPIYRSDIATSTLHICNSVLGMDFSPQSSVCNYIRRDLINNIRSSSETKRLFSSSEYHWNDICETLENLVRLE